jgi:hypothetical protein
MLHKFVEPKFEFVEDRNCLFSTVNSVDGGFATQLHHRNLQVYVRRRCGEKLVFAHLADQNLYPPSCPTLEANPVLCLIHYLKNRAVFRGFLILWAVIGLFSRKNVPFGQSWRKHFLGLWTDRRTICVI